MLNQFAGLTISQWIRCRRHCNTLRMITKFFRVFPASNSQKMFKKYILQTTDFLHQESILQLSQLFKSEIAVFENKVLLGSESISLHYVNYLLRIMNYFSSALRLIYGFLLWIRRKLCFVKNAPALGQT